MNFKVDAKKVLTGERRELARAITLMEDARIDSRKEASALLQALLPYSGRSLRVAITGIPGAGKSTFIEAMGMHLVEHGKKVAVLAIDPSGPGSGGSILGDKTRMEKLAVHPKAFVRPSPSEGRLGGVARKTRENIVLCEAAGYDVILVETVGVGQSEYEVAHMVDVVTLLLNPSTGDELQGIKRGIMEVADVIVVNKADGQLLKEAEIARDQVQGALGLFGHARSSSQVHLASSTTGHGIPEVWKSMEAQGRAQALPLKRAQQEKRWFKSLVWEKIEERISQDPTLVKLWEDLEESVAAKSINAHTAAEKLSAELFRH